MKKTLLFAATLCALAFSQAVNAQAIKGYGFEVSQGTWTPLTDATVITSGKEGITEKTNVAEVCYFKDGMATESKDDFVGIPIGFDFIYGDKTVTTFGVSGSGFIILRGNEAFEFNPAKRHYVYTDESKNCDDVVGLALPMNYYSDDSKISYKTEGEEGNRTLTIQYDNILVSTSGFRMSDTPGVCSFQYIFSEADNSIKVVFNNWKFEEGDTGSNARFQLRGKYNEGPCVEPFEDDNVTDWARATARVTFSSVPTITYGDGCGVVDGLTYTFTYPEQVVAPTAQPTNLQLSATPTSIIYAFDLAEDADTYLVVYTEGTEVPAAPQNGVYYEQGATIGAATVAYFGTYPEKDYEREINGLTKSSDYTVYIYAANAFGKGGPAYLTDSPLSAFCSTTPECPAEVTISGSTLSTVSGTAVANEDDNEVLVVYTTKIVHNFPMASSADYGTPNGDYNVGDTVEEGHDGKVAYVGPAGDFTIEGLADSSPVFVAVYSRDAKGIYSDKYVSAYTSTTYTLPFEPDLYEVTPYMDPSAGWTCEYFQPNWARENTEEGQINYIDYIVAKNVKGTVDNPSIAYAQLPKIDVTQRYAEMSLEWNGIFQAGRFGTSPYTFQDDNDFFEIQISEDAETWTTLKSINKDNAPVIEPEQIDTFMVMTAALDDYVGKQVYIRVYLSNTQAGWGATFKLRNLKIEGKPIPVVPVVSVDEVTYETAAVTWRGEQTFFEIQYGEKDATEEELTSDILISKSYLIEGLVANTEYKVRVRGLADNPDDWSEWSEFINFTTKDWPKVSAPTDLNAELEGFTAVLTWSDNDDYETFDLRYRPGNVTSWTTVEGLTENTYTVENLENNTTYLWTVRANCTHERVTSWATQAQFEVLVDAIVAVTAGSLRVGFNNGVLNVLNPGIDINNISVYDAQGRTVGSFDVNSNANVMIPMNVGSGIYIIKVEANDGSSRSFNVVR